MSHTKCLATLLTAAALSGCGQVDSEALQAKIDTISTKVDAINADLTKHRQHTKDALNALNALHAERERNWSQQLQESRVSLSTQINTANSAWESALTKHGQELDALISKQTELLTANANSAKAIQASLTGAQDAVQSVRSSLEEHKKVADTTAKRLQDVTEMYRKTQYIVLGEGADKLQTTALPTGTIIPVTVVASTTIPVQGSNSSLIKTSGIALKLSGPIEINGISFEYKDQMTFMVNAYDRGDGALRLVLNSSTFVDNTGLVRTNGANGYFIDENKAVGVKVPGYTPRQRSNFVLEAGTKGSIILTRPLEVVAKRR